MSLQSWFDHGQNRESGGSRSERTPYATETAESGGHVADGGSHGGGETCG
jgi:hypothetical protein